MKLFQVLGLVLLSLSVSQASQCSVLGHWKNELGSNMTISQISNNGIFNGTFMTKVSTTNNKILISPLVGWQQSFEIPTFGFVVKWSFSNTTTVFVGQCFLKPTGERVLHTTWLLRSCVNETNNWNATRVGGNTFTPI